MEYRPRTMLAHPNIKGTGSAMSISIFPATSSQQGYLQMEFTNQHDSAGYLTYDWTRRGTIRLDMEDIGKILMVLCGMRESIDDGKGLFRRYSNRSVVFKFMHKIDPKPHYSFNVHIKWEDKPEGEQNQKFDFSLSIAEGVALEAGLKAAMGRILFGDEVK